MAAPADFYDDPAERLEREHEREVSCRVCIYNARHLRRCLHPRGTPNYPDDGDHCLAFKHKEH